MTWLSLLAVSAVAAIAGSTLVPWCVEALEQNAPEHRRATHPPRPATPMRRAVAATLSVLTIAGTTAWVPSPLWWATLPLAIATPILTIVDLDQLLIPDRVTGPLFLASVAAAVFTYPPADTARALAAAAVTYLVFRVMAASGPFGLGDVKLAAAAAVPLSFLGPWGPIALAAAFPIALVAMLPLLLSRRMTRATPIPMGPALASAALLALWSAP